MYYFDLYTTRECNLNCVYCAQDKSSRQKAEYDLEHLKKYISGFQGEKCIVFYGGEPLLNIDFIREVMNFFRSDDIKFGIQTNGTLLGRLSREELLQLDMIMVSVDGYEAPHDKSRGHGTYRTAIHNVIHIMDLAAHNMEIRKHTKVYARLTISDAIEYADYSVIGLMNCFDGIFWQTCEKDYAPETYIAFSEAYNEQMRRVIDFWYSGLKAGSVISFPVFNLVYRDLALARKCEKVRCGANSTHFTIDIDGSIFPCVDSVFEQEYKIGHISECDSSRRHRNPVSCNICRRCAGCDVKDICGGACWMDINNCDIGREYAYVKCSNITSIIKHIESYVNEDKGKYLALVHDDIEKNNLFYGYCEEMP